MGSSFSILNDTKEELYMTHYNCQAALWGSIGAVLAVTTGGIATVGILAGKGCIFSKKLIFLRQNILQKDQKKYTGN